MGGKRGGTGNVLISHRFAVAVIAILFCASMAGWIATEIVPPDFPARQDLYRRAWGEIGTGLVLALRLFDPFHSLWYRFILALFFVVLLLCVVTRWRQLALGSWRAAPPGSADELRKKPLAFEFSWRLLESGEAGSRDPLVHYAELYGRAEQIGAESLRERFMRVGKLFRRSGYAISSREDAAGVSFAAYSGRWRSIGSMLFHAGLIVITIGGVIGSFGGWRESVLVREGTAVPLPRDSALALRVDRFEIVMTRRLEVKDFISTISVMDERGGVIAAGDVEVNHPMKVAGRRIYQNEFTIDQNTFERARVRYSFRDASARGTVDLVPGVSAAIGDSAVVLTAVRYISDFRMSPDGPFSASAFPSNPALEVDVAHAGQVERGWLFLYHPDFNKRFAAPVELVLDGCEPVYYTGLDVSSNPGASALFAGFAAATIGLLVMYLSNPRVVKGVLGADAIVVAATEYHWKGFEREFTAIREAVRTEFGPGG